MRQLTSILGSLAVLGFVAVCLGGTAQAGQDKYYHAAKGYADAMVERGRDTYGPKHTPLFAAALDREKMTLGHFPGVKGVRGKDRSMFGANPQDDRELYEILYTLTELTGDAKYGDAADDALEYFFKNCRSPRTDLLAWGEHLFWNLKNESMGPRRDKLHEIRGAWPFWDACYRLAPDASWQVALAFWDHQIHDKQTGNFSRHALWYEHDPHSGAEFPRYAGQMILTWADAYARPENANRERRAELLTAIRVIMERMKGGMALSQSGYLAASYGGKYVWPASNLELARCLYEARPLVPKALADEMQQLALELDRQFHEMPHTITEPDGGIATELVAETGKPHFKKRDQRAYSRTWTAGYGLATHADMANRCYRRYLQLKNEQSEVARKYRALILAAAEHYLGSEPRADRFLRPDAVAPAIELLLHTHEMTGEDKYLDRARDFADMGIEQFIDETSPLPKASNRHDHYEAVTGGPRLMLLLLRLHQVENGQITGDPPYVPADGF